MIREYGQATYETADGAFAGGFVRGTNVLCPDGKRRTALPSYDGTADTFYSVPAFVYARHEGKTVRVYGYVTIDHAVSARDGRQKTNETADVLFVPYLYRKYARAVCHPVPATLVCKHCNAEVHEVRNAGTLAHYVHTGASFLCDIDGYRNGTVRTHAETDDVPTAYAPMRDA